MANTQTSFHLDHSSLITYIQHPQPNYDFVPQPSFNTNYMPQPMQNLEDSSDPTTAFDMALALMAKAFTLNGEGHYASTSHKAKEKDAALSSDTTTDCYKRMKQGIQLNYRNFDFNCIVPYEEIEKVTANCNLQDNLQQASTSGTQSNKAHVYDSDGSAQNDSNVISVVSIVEQSGGTVEQHPVNVEETRVLYDSLYNNLAIEVEKVNSVNRKLRETNAI
ncbi:hypothetical protein Tco_1002404 [Tanacetum coccineum]|uniref:Uncharacterized protein n=1 Tax=Tanacetum coccineum TaxID=301880 RepID=A0ABQ5F6A3_9ASTR